MSLQLIQRQPNVFAVEGKTLIARICVVASRWRVHCTARSRWRFTGRSWSQYGCSVLPSNRSRFRFSSSRLVTNPFRL